MSHSQRCISANRFGDGFDCICDEEPLAKTQAELRRRMVLLGRLAAVAQVDSEEMMTSNEVWRAFHEMQTLLKTAGIKPEPTA